LFKNDHVFERYLSVTKCDKFKIAVSKLKCSDHWLEIEIFRHRSIPRNARLQTMQNESCGRCVQFILICPVLYILRVGKYVYNSFEFRQKSIVYASTLNVLYVSGLQNDHV
jgi:hypothetical protein